MNRLNKLKGLKIPAAALVIIGGIVAIEGGWVNHPNDPGGETNFGITKKVAQSHGYNDPMKDIPLYVVEGIYYEDYINKPRFTEIVNLIPPVGEKLVDAGVNVGTSRVSKWYQHSLNSFSRGCKDYNCIVVDGSIGKLTLVATQGLINKRGKQQACDLLLKSLDIRQGSHYINLHSLSDFTVGWISNRIQNIPLNRCDEL